MKKYLKPEMEQAEVEVENIIAISKYDDVEADPEVPILSKDRLGIYHWQSEEEAALEEENYIW